MRTFAKVGTGGPPVRDSQTESHVSYVRSRTRRLRVRTLAVLASALFGTALASESSRITYEDDVLPIFRNNCLKCHNPDKLKGDLDLTSFSSAIKGGGSGATLNAGDPEGSQLYRSIMHTDEPTMPPNAKLPDKDIATIREWIKGGLLQGVNSKALAASKPAADLSLKAVSVGKPDGPPPMPGPLMLEPYVRPTHGSALAAIASSPWAPVVALASAKQIVLYNTDDLEFIGVLPFLEGFPCDVKFSRNGKLLLTAGGRGGQSGEVIVWDITTGERVITVGDQYDSVLAADISADQRWIALGGPDRVLKIYNTKDASLEHRIKKHTEWVTAVEFSPDSKFLATGDRNGGLVLWEADTGHEMFTLAGHKGAITAVSWRSDSQMFASSSEDGTIKLWKASDGSSLRSINAHNGGVLSARFATDGRIVSCGRDNKIQVWETSGKTVLTPAFSGDLPNRVTFSEDGKKIVGSDWQGKVFVWDAKTGKPLGELESNPPTLIERVQLGAKRIGTLQAELDKLTAAQTGAVTDAAVKQVVLDERKKTLAETQSRVAAAESELKKLTAPPGAGAGDKDAVAKQIASTRETLASLSARIASLQKEVASAAKDAAAAAKKLSDATTAVEDATAKLAAAKTSLAKWQSVQRSASVKGTSGKVSMR